MAMTEKVKVAVIGVGGMGCGHANAFLKGRVQGAELVAVCDTDPARLALFSDDLKKFSASGELIRSGVAQAVTIATPHYAHTTIGADALEQGLHVLVEKPISVHKADAERLIAAYRPGKQVFAAMFNQRTKPFYQKLRQLVQQGELGELVRVNWIVTTWFRSQGYYDSGGWRATWAGEGGGVLLNQCPHNLDLLQWICGMPCSVQAFGGLGKRHRIEVEDEVTAYMEYPNGATGLFVTSTGEAPGTNRLEICGERGKLVCEDEQLHFTRNEVPTDEFCRTTQKRFGGPPVWHCRIPVSGKGGSHVDIIQNFVDAIATGAPLLAPATEGLHSVELGNGMLLSLLTGRRVDLPLDGREFELQLKQLIATSRPHEKTGATTVRDDDLAASFNG